MISFSILKSLILECLLFSVQITFDKVSLGAPLIQSCATSEQKMLHKLQQLIK